LAPKKKQIGEERVWIFEEPKIKPHWKDVLLSIYNDETVGNNRWWAKRDITDDHPVAKKLKISGSELMYSSDFLEKQKLIEYGPEKNWIKLTEKGFDVAVKIEARKETYSYRKGSLFLTAILALTTVATLLNQMKVNPQSLLISYLIMLVFFWNVFYWRENAPIRIRFNRYLKGVLNWIKKRIKKPFSSRDFKMSKSQAVENVFLIFAILTAVLAAAFLGPVVGRFVFQDLKSYIIFTTAVLFGVIALIVFPLVGGYLVVYRLFKKKIENFGVTCFVVILSTLLPAILGEEIVKAVSEISLIQKVLIILGIVGGLFLLITFYFVIYSFGIRLVSSFIKRRKKRKKVEK
jgi:hypothetical protein